MSETDESHHEDAHEDSHSEFSNGFSSTHSIPDQLKRDVLTESSADSNLAQFQRDCLVMGAKIFGVEGFSRACKSLLNDDVRLKEKAKSLAGNDGDVTGVVAVKRLHSWHVTP